MSKVQNVEIWGIPDDKGSYSRATWLDPTDEVQQIKLQSLGYQFWRFASFLMDEEGQLLPTTREGA